MTAIIGAEPPWTAPGTANGLPERRLYVYRGKHPLTDQQRARVERGLAELAATPRPGRSQVHIPRLGWSSTHHDR